MKLCNLTLVSMLLISPAFAQGLNGEFESMDTNNDGYISAEELNAAQTGTLSKQNEETMSILDKDGNGSISQEEYVGFYSQLSEEKSPQELEGNYKVLDTNHDGSLDVEELKAFRETTMDDTNQAVMNTLDADKDNRISREEYDNFVKSMEEMFKNIQF